MKLLVRQPKPPKITINSKNEIVIKKQDDRIVIVKTV